MRYPIESIDRMFDQFRRDMFELRGNLPDSLPELRELSFGTALDLTEAEDEYVLTVDMPGFERDEIDLRFADGQLWLTAEHETTDDVGSRRRSMRESVVIPRAVEADEISASYHNGVLEVHLPIVEGAHERGHRIELE
ncbi:MAG: Hsp20/alpha crystallin family protein [Halobacteriales archaeon]|nr:Hsp20/alpha crystallin family protein [Halobacteriales archaeon]